MAQIPVNTRAVGDPKGDYLLYLEDYVHTFIRKVYQEDSTQGKKREISLWGYEFEEQGRVYLVISGAIDQSLPAVSGERFFPSCYCIGQATIQEGTDTQIGLEITAPDGSKIVVRDFYIYYDQNEEMQNYLIEWNLTHNKGRIRTQSEDAVRFTRMTQACNREEARVSYLWNAMNLLSLGLMVCVAAFGIISVNNYHKMKDMEIYITKRSYNLQSEFRKYVWAKDKDGNYINEPEDHDNHGIDAVRYYVLGELLGKIQKPKDLTGIFTH